MGIQIRLGGTWQTITGLKIYAGGAWRNILAAKVYSGGSWRDVANFTPPPGGGGGGGGGSMTASASPSSQTRTSSSGSATSGAVTVTPSGGLAPYTYSHVVLAEDGTSTINSPTLAITTVTSTGLIVSEPVTPIFRCTVTDSLGVTATADYHITFSRIS